jgi:hypothetical protein
MTHITIPCIRCEAGIEIAVCPVAEEPETWGDWGGSPRIPAHIEVNDETPTHCDECGADFTPEEVVALEKAIERECADYEPPSRYDDERSEPEYWEDR